MREFSLGTPASTHMSKDVHIKLNESSGLTVTLCGAAIKGRLPAQHVALTFHLKDS